MSSQELEHLAKFGFTSTGAAIVDAIWFNGASLCQTGAIGMVLIKNLGGFWKCYIDVGSPIFDEELDAKLIAENGAKVPFDIAAAAFPGRFTRKNYDR